VEVSLSFTALFLSNYSSKEIDALQAVGMGGRVGEGRKGEEEGGERVFHSQLYFSPTIAARRSMPYRPLVWEGG
jgi:hypothetical protein